MVRDDMLESCLGLGVATHGGQDWSVRDLQ